MGEKIKTVIVDEQDFNELRAGGVKNFSAFVRESVRNAVLLKRRESEREQNTTLKCDSCGTEAPKSAWKSWKGICPNQTCGVRHYFLDDMKIVEKAAED